MGVKKTGWIATAAAGVVLVGGGAWAATAIASDEPAAEPVIVTTPGGEPNSVPVETATPTPTPEVAYSEEETIFLEWARPLVVSYGAELTDAEMLGYLADACEAVEANGGSASSVYVFPEAEDDAGRNVNTVFTGAADNGYGPVIDAATGARASYCD